MAKFIYKAKGKATPSALKNMSKIYFCCHPEDFEIYFEEISNDILQNAKESTCAIIRDIEHDNTTSDFLEKSNCTLLYHLENDSPDDFSFDLENSQLLVLVVSSRLLYQDSRAQEEFEFAIKKHIPVLPIVVESGLEEEFNRRFGDLQYLDKTNIDPTVISYKEKLSKYLSSVLIGDELAEKIRKAFDAYVFLSYRKKDRKYANELMKLIHKNELCRDIAIWYDEYLVPGEGFNDAIAAALKKSEMMALVVTPNLVNEENYVMTEEYPAAQREKKPVLPMEIVPTDRDSLREKYVGIPECIDPTDNAVLETSLLEPLKHIALRVNDSNPEHTFFIGLAYLNGIDVEIDRERAVQLITSAADAGLTEAIKKLIHMYRTGEGVGLNYNLAIKYQRRLLDICEEEYYNCSSEQNGIDYIEALWTLGNFAVDRGIITAAEKLYEKMYSVASEVFKKFGDCRIRRYIAISCACRGNIKLLTSDMRRAQELYEECCHLHCQISQVIMTFEAESDLVDAFHRLARVEISLRDYDAAKEHLLKCKGISLKLLQKNNNRRIRYIHANILATLGEIEKEQGNFQEARTYCDAALNDFNVLAQEHSAKHEWSCCAETLAILGDIELTLGDTQAARENYLKSNQLLWQLNRQLPDFDIKYEFLNSFRKLGEVELAAGALEKAKEYYRKHMKLAEVLADNKYVPIKGLRALSVSYCLIGDVETALGNYEEAWRQYTLFQQSVQKLAQQTTSESVQRDFYVSCYKCGSIAEKMADLPTAKKQYQEFYMLSKRAAHERDIALYKKDFIKSCICMVRIERKLEKFLQSREYCVEGCSMIRELTTSHKAEMLDKTMRAQIYNITDTLRQIADHCKLSKNYKDAKETYTIVIDLYREIARILPEAYEHKLVDALCDLANLSYEQKEYNEAAVSYENAIAMFEGLTAIEEAHNSKFAYALSRLGDCFSYLKKYEDASQSYQKAIKKYEKLLNTNPDHQQDIARVFYNIGNAYYCMNKYNDAVFAYSNALVLYRRLSDKDSEKYAEKIANTKKWLEESERRGGLNQVTV